MLTGQPETENARKCKGRSRIMNNVIDSKEIYAHRSRRQKRANIFDALYALAVGIALFTEKREVDIALRVISGIFSFVGGYIFVVRVVNFSISLPAAILTACLLILTGGFAIRSCDR